MRFSRIFAFKTLLLLAVLAFISMPALAALSVNTNSVTFAWTAGTQPPNSQQVLVSGAESFSANVVGTDAALFATSATGNTVWINLNLSTVPAKPNGTYTATLQIQAGGETQNVTLTLIKGGTITIAAYPSTVSLIAAASDTYAKSQTVTLTPSPALDMSYTTSVSTTGGGNWLSVSPVSGTVPAAGRSIDIIGNPAGLGNGTYNGTVTVNAGSASTTISVTFYVGTSTGSTTVSPAAMSFPYTAASGVVPGAQSLTVYSPSATTVSAATNTTSGGSWLLVNGYTSTSVSVIAGSTSYLSVSVNPLSLGVGTYYGTITVATGGVTQSVVQVTLNVNNNTGASASPTALSFTTSGTLPVSVYYTGAQTGLTYTASPSSTGWLSVSTGSGAVPGTFYVSANTAGLSSGTYAGSVNVTIPGIGFTQTVSVTLTVGGGTSTGTAFGVGPSQLTFNAQAGIGVSSQPIAINGPANQYFTATASTNDGGQWLSVSATTGMMPGKIDVSVNPSAAGTAGTYYGTIQIGSPSGIQAVSVILNVLANPVLIANPGGVAISYDPTTGTIPDQNIYLSSSAPSTTAFTYTTTTTTSWLFSSYGLGGATDSGDPRIIIRPTVTALTPGVNSGSITITGTARNGGPTSVAVVPVTVIYSGTGSLSFSPTALSFSAVQGITPAAQSVTISSTASTYFSTYATTTDGTGWLLVSPASGYAPNSLSVSANSSSLSAGTYTGTIYVTASGYTQTIPVTLTVGGVTATLSVDNVALNFDYQQGASTPAAKTLQVTSSGSQVNISASAATSNGASWLSVSPAAGTTPSTLTVSVNPASLAPGTYTGTVTVASASASNSPQTRTVTLTVRAAAALSLSTNTMTFMARDGAVPGSQTLSVSSSGDPITFSVSTGSASWLTASPATGTTPATISLSVNPAGLAAGTYTGRVVVQGTGGSSSSQAVDVTLTVTAPLATIARITNAASYAETAVAPGELVVLFGSFMGPNDLVTLKLDSTGRVAKNLSDVRVLFSGIEAPVIYASANQVSAVVPYALAGRSTASVQVEYRGVRSNSMTMNVATTAPGIFTLNSSGTGAGVVLNQDYSVNSGSNAAARGSIVIVYATGEGQTVPLGVDGGVNNDPNNLPAPVLPVTATIDGQPATVHYAGAAPGMVSGVLQLNIEVPAGASTGNVPLVINAGGLNSQPGVTLAVK